jgi:hypothetical protein
LLIDCAGATARMVLPAVQTPLAVVAVPVRNEVERIGACLDALAAQEGAGPFGVVLFLNNCTDGTRAAVERRTWPMPLRVVVQDFAGAHAGWARREAREAAARWLEEGGAEGACGTLLTTDADSRVPPDWIARCRAGLAAGADLVAGRIALDADEAARLPAALHARGRREGAYEARLIEIEARLDPDPHDPWPRHWTHSGATLAVRLDAYRAAGGMPAVPVGEDRAFVARLAARDARLRHDPAIVVVTSGRLDARAPGGAADTMRLRCAEPESPCDARLEALPRAVLRVLWRRRLRRLHAAGRLDRTWAWAPWLGVGPARARAVAALPSAAEAIQALETEPHLAHRPLRPRALPGHTRLADALLAVLRYRPTPRGPAAPSTGGLIERKDPAWTA